MKKLLTVLFAIVICFTFSCCAPEKNGPTSSQEPATDSVKILNATLLDGFVQVKIKYQLFSSEQGELMIGCRLPETKDEYIIIQDNIIIEKGEGEYVFSVDRLMFLSYDISVDLSAYPHEQEWHPLATDFFNFE